MRIGVDIDGVLNDIGQWHYSCGFKFCIDNHIQRGFHPYEYMMEKQFELTDEENYKFWREYIFDLMVSVPTRPYAGNVLKSLKEMGHEIVILTARDNRYLTNQYANTMNFYVEEWLHKNNIPYDEIVAGPGKKRDKCIKHKLDIMIEDKASNVLEISDVIPVLCFDAPYNLEVVKKNVHRVYSWYQIYQYFLLKDKEELE
ncbi:MAG: hypothetical protein PUD25_03035 [Bacilli bacterium]|nr:hypothetical protein [Bacilli bacterium]